MKRIITSESVTEGHPDKICDKISDKILDTALEQDKDSKMAVECTIKDDIIFIYGEATTKAKLDYEKIAKDMLAEGESGWDYTPRYNNHALDFIQIDLNSLLYAFECNMSYFAKILENGESELWNNRAEERKALIIKYLWCEERGTFLDRNYITGEWSPVFSGASFFSMMCSVATKEQAASMQKLLPLIEYEHGIACCERHNIKATYQWDYPNCWAPVQHAVVAGLKNYGFLVDVKRLSRNFTEMLENCFDLTGNLWEKYNAVDGTINVTNEYEMPTMLGWTAGVYLYCLENL